MVYGVPDLLLDIKLFVLSVVFKSSVCHLGKPSITPVFKMASKTAASYRNVPRNEIACPIFIVCIIFGFKMHKTCQNDNSVKSNTQTGYCYNIAIDMAATTFLTVAVQFHTFVYNNKCLISRI